MENLQECGVVSVRSAALRTATVVSFTDQIIIGQLPSLSFSKGRETHENLSNNSNSCGQCALGP